MLLVSVLLATGCSEGTGFRVTDEMRERAAQRSDPAAMIESAEALLRWHTDHGTRVALRPGIDQPSLQLALGGLPCTLPEELLALWRWRDGESSDQFLWYHEFLSLEAAMDEYKSLRRFPLVRWRRDWFPALRFQDEWFFVECAQELRPASPVMHFFLEDRPRYVFVNLTTMLTTLAEAARSGALRVDANGDVLEDIAATAAIHARLNPGTEFPYTVP